MASFDCGSMTRAAIRATASARQREGCPGEQGVQAEVLERGEHRGDVAVGQAADAGEDVLGVDERFTAEDTPHGLDGRVRQLGEVGERAFLDAAAFPVGLAEQDGGWG